MSLSSCNHLILMYAEYRNRYITTLTTINYSRNVHWEQVHDESSWIRRCNTVQFQIATSDSLSLNRWEVWYNRPVLCVFAPHSPYPRPLGQPGPLRVPISSTLALVYLLTRSIITSAFLPALTIGKWTKKKKKKIT